MDTAHGIKEEIGMEKQAVVLCFWTGRSPRAGSIPLAGCYLRDSSTPPPGATCQLPLPLENHPRSKDRHLRGWKSHESYSSGPSFYSPGRKSGLCLLNPSTLFKLVFLEIDARSRKLHAPFTDDDPVTDM